MPVRWYEVQCFVFIVRDGMEDGRNQGNQMTSWFDVSAHDLHGLLKSLSEVINNKSTALTGLYVVDENAADSWLSMMGWQRLVPSN